jgi:hypothetical protein
VASAGSNPTVVVSEVRLPQTSHRRDLWFRFYLASPTTTTVRAYATRALAVAAGAYIGSATITLGAAEQSITIARNGTAPDMQGTVLRGVFSANPATFAIWAYTATPDLVVADNIRTMLTTYAGVGQALACLAETSVTAQISVGDPGKTPVLPHVAIVPQSPTIDVGRPFCGSDFEIVIQAAVCVLKSKEEAFRSCKELLAACYSILADEQIYLYGESGGPVNAGGIDTPAPTQSELYIVGQFTLHYTFNLWRDDGSR